MIERIRLSDGSEARIVSHVCGTSWLARLGCAVRRRLGLHR